jgi:hypothetical protein
VPALWKVPTHWRRQVANHAVIIDHEDTDHMRVDRLMRFSLSQAQIAGRVAYSSSSRMAQHGIPESLPCSTSRTVLGESFNFMHRGHHTKRATVLIHRSASAS